MINFQTIRDPLEGEVSPGHTNVRIGVDRSDQRWVLRKGEAELYAYATAKTFFGGIVPETVLFEGGTAQKWVQGTTAHNTPLLYREVRKSLQLIRDLGNMISLDYAMNNPDRHGNNWMLTNNGRIAAIDNTISSEFLPLRSALRPVFRCLLADDPDLTPMLIGQIRSSLFNFSLLSPSAILMPTEDLIMWEHELSHIPGI